MTCLVTCLRGVTTRLNALARTIVVLITQDRIVDLEQGAGDNTRHEAAQPEPLVNVLSADVLTLMRRKLSTISRSICRLTRRKPSEVNDEKSDSNVESAQQPIAFAASMPVCQEPARSKMDGDTNPQTLDVDRGSVSPSPSLSISSILDLMPIPVTTPEERALAASILAARNTSPTPPPTPSLMSPTTDSSHDSSFSPELEVSSVLNTPSMLLESTVPSPTQGLPFSPFLEQAAFMDVQVYEPSGRSLLDISEEGDSSSIREPWTGNAGFKFPTKPPKSGKKRNLTYFCPPPSIVEEDDYEHEAANPIAESQLLQKDNCREGTGLAASDSPWDDGCNENYGLKGRAFWRQTLQAMKRSDSKDQLLQCADNDELNDFFLSRLQQ